jgi:hypothetical protein
MHFYLDAAGMKLHIASRKKFLRKGETMVPIWVLVVCIVLALVIGFGAGALVYRNNKALAERAEKRALEFAGKRK